LDLESYLEERRGEVVRRLEALLPPPEGGPPTLHEAMRYTLFLPGKRLRAILCLAVSELVEAPRSPALSVACGLEMVHTASIILDDLPMLDDSDLRRGRPSCHRVFGEAVALLAAVALLNEAYRVLAREFVENGSPARGAGKAIDLLARCVGPSGVIGGEAAELDLTGGLKSISVLEGIHRRKTGSLFHAAAVLAAELGAADSGERESLCGFAEKFGLAFQITDDLLDEPDGRNGEEPGEGRRVDRANFVAMAGSATARQRIDQLIDEAREDLAIFGDRAGVLHELAELVRHRDH
jgi:geranylgeranyl diphosphate synthase type II